LDIPSENLHYYLVDPLVYGDSGETFSFKLYNHEIGEEMDLIAPDPIAYTENGYGTVFTPHVLNFTGDVASNHWTPVSSGSPGVMVLLAKIQINGVDQNSDQLELGVFCGSECRGSKIAHLLDIPSENLHYYLVDPLVYGDSGETFSFKLYNHEIGEEMDLIAPDPIAYTENGYGNLYVPYILNFTQKQTQTVIFSVGWNWWAPTVATSIETVEQALGDKLVSIQSKQGPASGEAIAGDMYRIQTNAACTLSLSGMPMGTATVALQAGPNWFGYTGDEEKAIAEAVSVEAATGDKIVSQYGGFAIYNGTAWQGTLTTLQPGCGYVYVATENKTLTIE